MSGPARISPRLLGWGLAAAAFAVDRGDKLWMLNVFDIEARQPVHVGPFFELVLAWNRGISYSLFSAQTARGRDLLLATALVAILILALWLRRARDRITAGALGLIIGGALGNAYDRLAYGAVADFFHFHAGSFSWYVFNLADVAIVAGVALLLYESFLAKPKGGLSEPAS